MSTRREFLSQALVAGAMVTGSAGLGANAAAAAGSSYTAKGTMTRYRIEHTDLDVSRIAFGCSWLSPSREPLSADTIAKAARLINTAYDNGINFFDHADVYSYGTSEEVFGEVLRQSPGLRQKVVIQSKCGMSIDGKPMPYQNTWALDLSYEHIIAAVEGSLRRLGTDHLDILLLHWPDSLARPEEVARAFDALHSSGKVRHFGVSNHTRGQMELLQATLRRPLVTNQIQLSLGYSYPVTDGIDVETQIRVPSDGIVDYCRLHRIRVQAWSPLRGAPLKAPPDASPELQKAAKVLAEVAADRGTTPPVIALAWLLHHPAGIIPVFGSTNPDHVSENCAADRLTLTRDEWYALLAAAAKVQSRTIA